MRRVVHYKFQFILGKHMIKKNDQWQGLTSKEVIWECFKDIHRQYPHFNLENKVLFNGEGNDNNTRRRRSRTSGHMTQELVKKAKWMKWWCVYCLVKFFLVLYSLLSKSFLSSLELVIMVVLKKIPSL